MGKNDGFRFSLKTLLASLTICAVGAMALRTGDWFWARIWFSLFLAILLGSILGAIYRTGSRRAFWIGFALFGWTYILIVTFPAFSIAEHQLLGPFFMEVLKEYVPEANNGLVKEVGGQPHRNLQL